jgi:uncharacterized protein YdhG (YjbR/CyaY superfamily)
MDKHKYQSIEAYHAAAPADRLAQLKAIHRIIKAAAPQAEEVISYNMPAFKMHGVLVYYAWGKTHLGFYPTGTPVSVFADRLKGYKTSKGAIQFPLDQPLPEALIQDIVRYRIQEDENAFLAKKRKK